MNNGEKFGKCQHPRFCIPAPKLALLSFVCTVSVGLCLGRDQMLPKLQGSNARKPKSQGTISSWFGGNHISQEFPPLACPAQAFQTRTNVMRNAVKKTLLGEKRHFCMIGICSLPTFAPSQWPWMWQESFDPFTQDIPACGIQSWFKHIFCEYGSYCRHFSPCLWHKL